MRALRGVCVFGWVALVGCGGTFIHEGDAAGGSGGGGNSAGTLGHAGSAGSVAHGGDAGYGAVGGDITYGGYGNVGNTGGDIAYGGYGAVGGDVGGYGNVGNTGGDAGFGGTGCGYGSNVQATPVTFIFSANAPVYLRQVCALDFGLYGCDATTPLKFQAACVSDCNSGGGCLACGACALQAVKVAPGAPAQSFWTGETYTFGTSPNGCVCATGQPAGSGEYTIATTVYTSEADAMSGTNGIEVRQTFTYPPANGTVNVFVGEYFE